MFTQNYKKKFEINKRIVRYHTFPSNHYLLSKDTSNTLPFYDYSQEIKMRKPYFFSYSDSTGSNSIPQIVTFPSTFSTSIFVYIGGLGTGYGREFDDLQEQTFPKALDKKRYSCLYSDHYFNVLILSVSVVYIPSGISNYFTRLM